MGTVIYANFGSTSKASVQPIRLDAVDQSRRSLDSGLIAPASKDVETVVAQEHASEPIKRVEDINRISEYLVQNGRYRDNMIFIVGINFGLRVSDLIKLRFINLIDEDFRFRTTFPILETKTRNTRKVTKNRYLTINEAVMEAVTLYLQHNEAKLDDYMFRSESNNGRGQDKHISRAAVDSIIKGVCKELGIEAKVATHTLRKTFGYHQMLMSGNDPRKLLLLQKIFGHSSAAMTLEYIGITSEEIADAYLSLNLGSKRCYEAFNKIGEGGDTTSA